MDAERERENDLLAERLSRLPRHELVRWCDELLAESPDVLELAINCFEPPRKRLGPRDEPDLRIRH